MMHATFILFTGMPIEDGGLGYDEKMNGYIFAYVGLMGYCTRRLDSTPN